MLLTACDDEFRYRIEAPDYYEIRLGQDGTDFLLVPDPEQPNLPFWLSDFVLVDAARSGDFGLRLLSEEPLVGRN